MNEDEGWQQRAWEIAREISEADMKHILEAARSLSRLFRETPAAENHHLHCRSYLPTQGPCTCTAGGPEDYDEQIGWTE